MNFSKGLEKTAFDWKGVASNAGKWVAKNPGKTIAGVAAAGVGANLAQGKGVRQSLTSPVLAPNYQEAK